MSKAAPWVAIALTAVSMIVAAVLFVPSYADDKKSEAIAEHDADLASHKLAQDKTEEKLDEKIEKVDDKIDKLAEKVDDRMDAQMQILIEIRTEQKAANRRARNGR